MLSTLTSKQVTFSIFDVIFTATIQLFLSFEENQDKIIDSMLKCENAVTEIIKRMNLFLSKPISEENKSFLTKLIEKLEKTQKIDEKEREFFKKTLKLSICPRRFRVFVSETPIIELLLKEIDKFPMIFKIKDYYISHSESNNYLWNSRTFEHPSFEFFGSPRLNGILNLSTFIFHQSCFEFCKLPSWARDMNDMLNPNKEKKKSKGSRDWNEIVSDLRIEKDNKRKTKREDPLDLESHWWLYYGIDSNLDLFCSRYETADFALHKIIKKDDIWSFKYKKMQEKQKRNNYCHVEKTPNRFFKNQKREEKGRLGQKRMRNTYF